jgi:hypothetical protein
MTNSDDDDNNINDGDNNGDNSGDDNNDDDNNGDENNDDGIDPYYHSCNRITKYSGRIDSDDRLQRQEEEEMEEAMTKMINRAMDSRICVFEPLIKLPYYWRKIYKLCPKKIQLQCTMCWDKVLDPSSASFVHINTKVFLR